MRRVVISAKKRSTSFSQDAGGREMQPEPWMPLQPVLHLGRLVGGVVVEHDMNVARPEDRAVDAAQERQKLPGSVAGHAVADNHARLLAVTEN